MQFLFQGLYFFNSIVYLIFTVISFVGAVFSLFPNSPNWMKKHIKVIILFCFCMFITFFVRENMRKVPDVVGRTYENACNILSDYDLKYTLIAGDNLYVTDQKPEAGTIVFKNKEVELEAASIDSDGYRKVPDVIDKSRVSAIESIEELGLKVTVSEEYNDTVKAGNVISQNPFEGIEVSKNTTVYIVVSKGKEPEELILIPSVSGYDEATAKSKLEELGLYVKTTEQFHDTVEAGKVINQNPDAGEKAEKGTTVEITLSKGSDLVSVPSVINMDKNNAETNLINAGFKVNIQEEYSEDAATGQVISQNPSANTREPEGSTVTVTISKGAKPYVIYYESNGGSSIASQTGYSGRSLGDLPVPERDYNIFTGWYTADGTKVGSDTIFKNIDSIKLIAHWEQKAASEWTLWSQTPVDAWVVNEKWTYTRTTTETTWSRETSLDGYSRTGNAKWEQTAQGYKDWAEWVGDFKNETSNLNYGQPYYAEETETFKREVENIAAGYYVYWHYTYPVTGQSEETHLFNRKISQYYGKHYSGLGDCTLYMEFASSTAYPKSHGDAYCIGEKVGDAPIEYQCCPFWRETVQRCNYTEYARSFEYIKTTVQSGLNSNVEVVAEGEVSDVLHWVRYIPK